MRPSIEKHRAAFDRMMERHSMTLAHPPEDPAAEALRAAAPDLYESLAAVVALHDNETSDLRRMSPNQVIHHGECWERARKALKKAVAGVPDREPPRPD